MSNDEAHAGRDHPGSEHSGWVGYAVAALLVAAVTVLLHHLEPVFPLARFAIAFVVVVMVAAYLFGEGPALLAFVLGFISFVYSFVPPEHTLWPVANSAEGWASVVAFLLGMLVVGSATLMMRRSRMRIERLADELSQARDLAERRRGEIEAVFASMTSAVVVVDADARLTFANEAANRIFAGEWPTGETLETVARSARTRTLDGEPVSPDDLAIMRALRGEAVVERRSVVDGESGPDTVISVSAAPVRGLAGEVLGAVGIVRNITPEKRAQDALRESQEKYRDLVELISHGVIEIDTSGILTFANTAYHRAHGYASGELVGRAVWELFESESQAREFREYIAALAHDKPEPTPYVSRDLTKDGKTVDIQIEWDYKRDQAGNVTGFIAVATDVTEQFKSRRELERSYEREHRIAEALQSSLLPTVPERMCGFAFDTLYRPAWEEARVGGDFYDVFRIGDGRAAVVIGDVSGKGLGAAVQVAAAKYSVRGRVFDCARPGAAMAQVNRALFQDLDDESFITVFLGILDWDEKTLTYANAGHSPAILWKQDTAGPVLLEPTGPVVGIRVDQDFGERIVELRCGDELLLTTDGLYEVRCGEAFLDMGGLLDLYARLKQQGIGSACELMDRVTEYCRGDIRDDVAIVRVTVAE